MSGATTTSTVDSKKSKPDEKGEDKSKKQSDNEGFLEEDDEFEEFPAEG